MVQNANKMSTDVDATISYLSTAVERIQLNSDFPKVLTPTQLDDIYCVAIRLSAAIMDCLGTAISCMRKTGNTSFYFVVL